MEKLILLLSKYEDVDMDMDMSTLSSTLSLSIWKSSEPVMRPGGRVGLRVLCGHGKLMTSRKGLLASELPERYGEESCRKVKAMRKRTAPQKREVRVRRRTNSGR